jgi:DNA-binding YbaB/EbfC family protein
MAKGIMGGMGGLMKQAQKMQNRILKVQEEMAEKTIEASAGGGMVTVIANGRQEIVSIKVEKEVVDPDDVEMLEDLVLAAVNDALKKSQQMVAEEMQKITGGMNIPGLT